MKQIEKTLQDQYKLIKEGKGSKQVFLNEAKRLFPNKISNNLSFQGAVNTLKRHNIIDENIIGIEAVGNYSRPEENYETAFKKFMTEEAKAEEKKTSKEVEDVQEKAYDLTDKKLMDNINPDQWKRGLYFEAKKAPNKTLEEVEKVVLKNLQKDPIYYTKEGIFGVEGGYQTEAPGLGEPKEAKGPHKSSGYGTLKESSLTSILKSNIEEGKKKTSNILTSRLKEIEQEGAVATLEAKMNAVDEEIAARNERLTMIGENEDLADLVDKSKLKEMQRDIKMLEKQKLQLEKQYSKLTGGKKKKETVVDNEMEEDVVAEAPELEESENFIDDLNDTPLEGDYDDEEISGLNIFSPFEDDYDDFEKRDYEASKALRHLDEPEYDKSEIPDAYFGDEATRNPVTDGSPEDTEMPSWMKENKRPRFNKRKK